MRAFLVSFIVVCSCLLASTAFAQSTVELTPNQQLASGSGAIACGVLGLVASGAIGVGATRFSEPSTVAIMTAFAVALHAVGVVGIVHGAFYRARARDRLRGAQEHTAWVVMPYASRAELGVGLSVRF